MDASTTSSSSSSAAAADDDDNEEVILLSFWASMYGMRVRIALEEKGIKYKYREEKLLHKSELLLKMNPIYKKVPVLIHNGKPVCESIIALQYIDEVWKDKPSFFPSHPYEKAMACFWADFIDNKVYSYGRSIWMKRGEEQKEAMVEFIESLKLLEERALGDKPYFGGDKFGFLDLVLIGFTCWFYTYETYGNFTIGTICPKLMAWVQRCKERKSVSLCLADPNQIYEAIAKSDA